MGDTAKLATTLRSRIRVDETGDYVTPFDKALDDAASIITGRNKAASEDIAKIAAHCDKHERFGRAQFSVAGIRSLLAALTASESTVAAMRAERDTYQWADQKHSAQLVEATELVDALRAEVERLTKALEPFANYIAGAKGLADHVTISNGSRFARLQLTVGDCRTAARALDRSPSVESGNG